MNISEIKALCMVWEAYTGKLPPHIQDYNTLFAEIDRLRKRLEPIERVWESTKREVKSLGVDGYGMFRKPTIYSSDWDKVRYKLWQAIKEAMEVGDE